MSPARPDAAPAVKPIEVSPDLKALMRRLKLGQLLDTLPERLALARSNRLPHHDFLEMLLAADGALVSAEDLLEHVWDAHADPFSNIVSVTMARLRRKLGDPPLIETVVGKGYRM